MGKWVSDGEENERLCRIDDDLREYENRDWRILPLVLMLQAVVIALILWLYFRRT